MGGWKGWSGLLLEKGRSRWELPGRCCVLPLIIVVCCVCEREIGRREEALWESCVDCERAVDRDLEHQRENDEIHCSSPLSTFLLTVRSRRPLH